MIQSMASTPVGMRTRRPNIFGSSPLCRSNHGSSWLGRSKAFLWRNANFHWLHGAFWAILVCKVWQPGTEFWPYSQNLQTPLSQTTLWLSMCCFPGQPSYRMCTLLICQRGIGSKGSWQKQTNAWLKGCVTFSADPMPQSSKANDS